MKLAISLLGIVVVSLLGIAMLLSWERPPMVSTQLGYRGTGMEQVSNPRLLGAEVADNQLPDPLPPASAEGPRADEVYENVKVLGDLSEEQFIRVMSAITEWVSPDEGCGYCHNEENLAADDKYTKVVARRMLQMNRHINADWTDHVATTGVTCFTCHRGHPVPENIWFTDQGMVQAGGMAANRQGQNLASDAVGRTSLPYDPLTDLIGYARTIRVVSNTPLPETPGASIKDAEKTYALMIHMSESLGVNCTFCHNAQSFMSWDTSRPQRVTAFHGIQMVRELNGEYLASLKDVFPPNRLGPTGDVPKLNCATCHQGVSKPLLGKSMVQDYPELVGAKSN
jgi:photosynthetic reaction center cytochrome c subunit